MPQGNAHKSETRLAALEAFHGEEAMRAIGKRIGTHYTKVREWWVGEFGAEKVKSRGKDLQAKKTRENAKKAKGKPKNVSKRDVECDACVCAFRMSSISATKTARILCQQCKDDSLGRDLPCPVCSLLCNGKKGLGVHFQHQKDDEAHVDYRVQQGKPVGVEGVDYVVCPLPGCEHTAKSLCGHLEKVHKTTWKKTKRKYPDALWMATASAERRVLRSSETRKKLGYNKGERKEVACPTCDQVVEVSLYAGSLHDFRCEECKVEDELVRWAGKKELEDYVVCRECGHRAEFLNSHIQNAHGVDEYRRKHPDASLTALNAGQRKTPCTKVVLSVEDLKPFMNKKGQVLVSAVCSHVGCTPMVIRKICASHGLTTQNRLALQKSVLDHAAKYLGEDYAWEYSDERIRAPDTGWLLRFDGYFPQRHLLIEVQGEQHHKFIAFWQKTPENLQKRVELDKWKKQEAERLGYELKAINKNDPFTKKDFWQGLLGGDSSFWQNKTEAEQQEVVEEDFQALRKGGFPQLQVSMQAQAKFTSLCGKDVFLDGERVVSPPHSVLGAGVCASFFPNRHKAKHRSAKMSAYEAWHDDTMLKEAIRIQLNAGDPTLPERVLRALNWKVRTPNVFRPPVAKYVYQTYCPSGGVVWDPCAGFGGRLLGAMAAGVGKYLATDIESETVEGNRKIAEFYELKHRCELHCQKAQDFKPAEPLDLVFTSPPYFNLETYGEISDQKDEYSTVQKWVEGFLQPLIENGHQALKSGGYLVLNLPDKVLDGSHLPTEATRLARDLGMRVEQPLYMALRGKNKDGSPKREPLVVFRKP